MSAQCRKFGLLGFPLGHSFSKAYFEQKFDELHLSDCCSYENYELQHPEQIRQLLGSGTLSGLSVTIPHKQTVIGMLDSVSDEAAAIGAVNCIAFDDTGRSTGYNTDVIGFCESLRGFIGSNAVDLRALILGTGGAAAAVRYGLQTMGIDHHSVSRRQGQADYTYQELTPQIIGHHRLIINTTPLGMWPNTDTAPELPWEAVTPEHYAYDLVYNPARTQFMERFVQHGAKAMGGIEMLRRQAEAAWEIWNRPAPKP